MNNYTGVYLGSVDYATIINNDFNLKKPLKPNSNYTIGGLYLDECTGFHVEGNVFNNMWPEALETTNGLTVGLIVNDSWEQPTIIYNNAFSNLNYASLAQNENRNEFGDGLQFKCNDYANTVFDLVVTFDGNPSSNTGIALHQGSENGTDPEDMAGNLFEIIEPVDDDYDDIANNSQLIWYHFPLDTDGYGEQRLEPKDYTQNTVNLDGENFNPPWMFVDGCPTTFAQGSGVENLKQEMYVLDFKIDSTENVLHMLLDGGNTDELQSDVEFSTPPDAMEIYNDLMSETPYLSDTVVSTAIVKEDVLPNVMIRDVMVANPKSAKSEILMGKLDERIDPMPEYMKVQIRQGRSILSLREETEANLCNFNDKKSRVINKIITYYRSDSINPLASADSVLKLLLEQDKLWAKYALAFEYLDRDDTINAIGTLDSIPINFELSTGQLAVHEDFEDYFEILTSMKSKDKVIFQADSTDITNLYEIYENSNKKIKEKIRNLLITVDTLTYSEPYIFMNFTKANEVLEGNEFLPKIDQPEFLIVYPNPANNYIVANYQLEMQREGYIEIIDLSGNLRTKISIENDHGQIIFDTRGWESEIYVISLVVGDFYFESEKVSILR